MTETSATGPLGRQLIEDAIDLVVRELRNHPQGVRNSDVAAATGLDLPISEHSKYITWTILRYLVEQGRATKSGPIYWLKQ